MEAGLLLPPIKTALWPAALTSLFFMSPDVRIFMDCRPEPGPDFHLTNDLVNCKLNCYAPVAQLDRAPDYESVGRKFESCRAHQ